MTSRHAEGHGPMHGASAVDIALTRKFLLDYPREAALKIEAMAVAEAAATLAMQPVYALLSMWRYLLPSVAADILDALPEEHIRPLMAELPPQDTVRMLGQLEESRRMQLLAILNEPVRKEFAERHIPVGRFGEPEELACLAVFLASPIAGYISGSVIPVDGGLRRYTF